MWQVIIYTDRNDIVNDEYFFRKKENAENFFRRVLKKEISFWGDSVSPKDYNFDNWEDFIENCVRQGYETYIGRIQEIITED